MDSFFAAIVGALLGSLGALFINTFTSIVSARISLIDDFIRDLTFLEDLSNQYWLSDPGVSPDELSAISTKIRGKLHAARLFKKSAKDFLGEDYKEFSSLDEDLFTALTGGSFETKNVDRDPARATRVMAICAEIRALLRVSKRKAYWAR